jgi:hypothetical protein
VLFLPPAVDSCQAVHHANTCRRSLRTPQSYVVTLVTVGEADADSGPKAVLLDRVCNIIPDDIAAAEARLES